jgi:hypothetical protein
METRFNLVDAQFSEKEKTLLENANFQVSGFRYSSGVAALRMKNKHCELIVLPFQGQQVWRAIFNGRDLTMRSIFDEPRKTEHFGLNYGGFLIHCGLTGSGNPTAEDSHPLHGELPNAAYEEAFLIVDEKSLSLSGTYSYKNAIEYDYVFSPRLTMGADSSVCQLSCGIENKRSKPFKYMYMSHINWLPVEGSQLVYSAKKTMGKLTVYDDTFGLPAEQQAFSDYVAKVKQDPWISDHIDPKNQVYDPEFCLFIHYEGDKDNWAHALQVMPQGDACYVGFDRQHLPNAVRWYAWTGDEYALGFAIPSKTDHLGFSRNDAKGVIPVIGPKASIELNYCFGYLNPEQTQEKIKEIEEILN